MLYYTILYYIILYCITLYYIVLYYTLLYYVLLYYIIAFCRSESINSLNQLCPIAVQHFSPSSLIWMTGGTEAVRYNTILT